ncbi:hypothetical protein SARC_03739 [Sphaeroforma arctica JP610]|uniref:Uncharacterized protein n=1 Tax=Sphaeroforma arctica JP610 TaxID=667725 RepID=A0A0L0G724_9EUKA|nr:hypothetical protein SARC_03739 [Sphaeroforma arctica JP610]KNC84028.1 hypothetical protein SARC_03739 [Sphaeroforma arctica JP610]|eukprot:XP_014157930.1 hypothetical protein SARC_03739 [Sphaeroforma arctica JP610]
MMYKSLPLVLLLTSILNYNTHAVSISGEIFIAANANKNRFDVENPRSMDRVESGLSIVQPNTPKIVNSDRHARSSDSNWRSESMGGSSKRIDRRGKLQHMEMNRQQVLTPAMEQVKSNYVLRMGDRFSSQPIAGLIKESTSSHNGYD